MYQAIRTKFLGPTNTKGARVKAVATAGSVIVSWDHALNPPENHARAARVLAEKLNWLGQWAGGQLPDGSGYAFVIVDETSFTVD